MKHASDYAYDQDHEVWVIGRVLSHTESLDMQVYHPKQTTCLRCDALFNSYDPRYNRRCGPCERTVRAHADRSSF